MGDVAGGKDRDACHRSIKRDARRFDWATALAAQKIVVVPLAADARFSPQSDASIARVREKYALPTRYGLYVGINKPHKNLATLMEAWQRVNQTRRW